MPPDQKKKKKKLPPFAAVNPFAAAAAPPLFALQQHVFEGSIAPSNWDFYVSHIMPSKRCEKMMLPPDGHVESSIVAVESREYSSSQKGSAVQDDFLIEATVSTNIDDNDNTGWLKVKKKSRSTKSSTCSKTSSQKSVEILGKFKACTDQQAKDGSRLCLAVVEQPENLAILHEHVRSNPRDSDASFQCKDAVGSSLTIMGSSNKSPMPLSDEQMVNTNVLSNIVDTPKFRWGNLDDEDLAQNDGVQGHTENGIASSSVIHQDAEIVKNDNSTICLEGGKQSSTKEVNGIKNMDMRTGSPECCHVSDLNIICTESVNASESSITIMSNEQQNMTELAHSEELAKGLVFSTTKHSNHAVDDDVQSADTIGNSKQLNAVEVIPPTNVTSSMDLYNTATESTASLENVMDDATIKDATEYFPHNQDNDHDSAGPKASMKFSVAASMLIGKFEENQSVESKERFRQRLWCYLFENLNRAVDELYFLCELECDMEQIEEALLVLKEAGLDFNELKSRVEGFEKVKKHSSTSQSFGAKLEGSFCGKVEHRRPHAISWEVRRMACSPHRAEILSSSLEAFRKVQQITAEKNFVSQSKRREAAQLLIKQSCAELPKMPSFVDSGRDVNEPVSEVFDNPRSFMKDRNLLISDVQNVKEQHEKEVYAADPNVDVIGEACAISASEGHLGNCGDNDIKVGFMINRSCVSSTRTGKDPIITNTEGQNKSVEKRVSIIDTQREKKNSKVRSSMDAWKVKRNWEDVLSSPLKSLNRASRSPCTGWRSAERVKVLHDKLMSPERKRKSPLEMKKEVDEKQARATRIRRELENERVQRLQKTTEKLNRVSEWQAVRSSKLREGMHARQQRGESRHEAHLAEIARRAGDESSKVSEVRFITSLNEENKKLSLKQKLQDSELRRAERLQSMKIKQKEDIAREEAVLERRRIIEAERLQRLAEAQRRKEEAKARRDEERKAASAAREARAVEQVRKKEVRAKAQQEVTELQAQKLIEKLRESEVRRKVYLEQIRERATMDSREQASPSTRLSVGRDGQSRNTNQAGSEGEGTQDKEVKQNKGTSVTSALQHHALKKRMKKIRQRLMAKKHDFLEPPSGAEGSGIGTIAVAAAARSKVGRWLQDLQRCQLAKKAGASGVGFIVAEMVKYFDGKVAELHAARQAGLLDFIATALPASHTSKAEASQTTLSLLRILKVLLALPANRSYFISKNLLPPLIPMLSRALENFSSHDWVSATVGVTNFGTCTVSDKGPVEEKPDAIGEVLNGLLECMMLIMNHTNTDERQVSMKEDLVDLLVACEVIHHLRDMFSLFDRPQVEGAAFPVPVLLGLYLLQALTAMRIKVGLPYHLQFSAMIERQFVTGSTSKGEIKEAVDSSSDCNQPYLDCNQSTGPKEGDADEAKARKLVANEVVENLSIAKNDDVMVDATIMDIPAEDKETENVLISGSVLSSVSEVDEKVQMRQNNSSACNSVNFLVSAIADTGLVGLPSLLTAVLLQTNPRSTPEQAAAALPSNFNEVATCVLKVLNNLARRDLGLVQNLLAMPDLQMEFFHLVSFLLTHCTCKWSSPTDQVASLLFETLILLGYFALLHPGNQAVLRWGKSPTILHKICDLPFAFFSDPYLIPVLVGTLLAVCYGSEQNRDVIKEEISMDMLLSLLKSSRAEAFIDRDQTNEDAPTCNTGDQSSQNDVYTNYEKSECGTLLEEDSIPPKEEIKRMIETTVASDCDTSYNPRQQAASKLGLGRPSTADYNPSPGRKGLKITPKINAAIEDPIFGKETITVRSSMNKNQTKGSTASGSVEIATHLRKVKSSVNDPSTARVSSSLNASSVPNNQPPSAVSENPHSNLLDGVAPLTDTLEPCLYLRPDLMLQNRFPDCLLDKAEEFFSAVL